MKFPFTHLICIKHDETDDIIHQAKIVPNNKVAPYGNGRARIEEVELENEIQKFLLKTELMQDFKDWYLDNVDSAAGQVTYPVYDLRASYQIWEFMKLFGSQYTILLFQDSVEIKIEMEK